MEATNNTERYKETQQLHFWNVWKHFFDGSAAWSHCPRRSAAAATADTTDAREAEDADAGACCGSGSGGRALAECAGRERLLVDCSSATAWFATMAVLSTRPRFSPDCGGGAAASGHSRCCSGAGTGAGAGPLDEDEEERLGRELPEGGAALRITSFRTPSCATSKATPPRKNMAS